MVSDFLYFCIKKIKIGAFSHYSGFTLISRELCSSNEHFQLRAEVIEPTVTASKHILINAATTVTAVPFTHSKSTRSSAVIADIPRDALFSWQS